MRGMRNTRLKPPAADNSAVAGGLSLLWPLYCLVERTRIAIPTQNSTRLANQT